jgi:N-methylhydantoinase B/oxoprolinase/acetone carboxylase alpha subunit
MTSTRLNMPAALMKRISRLAAVANLTPNDFMVDVLAKVAARAEARIELVNLTAALERKFIVSEKSHTISSTFRYMRAQVAGKQVRRPRATRLTR